MVAHEIGLYHPRPSGVWRIVSEDSLRRFVGGCLLIIRIDFGLLPHEVPKYARVFQHIARFYNYNGCYSYG